VKLKSWTLTLIDDAKSKKCVLLFVYAHMFVYTWVSGIYILMLYSTGAEGL